MKIHFEFRFLFFVMILFGGSAENTKRSNGAVHPEDLPEGLWYEYPGKEKYLRLQTPVIPAETKVTIAVKVTQGDVKVFAGPNSKPREIFEKRKNVYANTEKIFRFAAMSTSETWEMRWNSRIFTLEQPQPQRWNSQQLNSHPHLSQK